jgi:hypothetical protein
MEYTDLTYSYKQNKKHDSTIWNKIAKNNPEKIKYGCAIEGQNENEYPCILHMGVPGLFGSICISSLTKTYEKDKVLNTNQESKIEEMTLEDIYAKYKTIDKVNNW